MNRSGASWRLAGACSAGLLLLLSLETTSSTLAVGAHEAGDPFCVLIALPTNSFTFIPAPADMPDRSPDAPRDVAINVTYGSGFAAFPQAQAAFQYAVDIWETQLTSSVPISVQADFSALSPGVLGSAGFNYIIRNFSGAPMTATWFPGPIANALAGTPITPAPAINANFSSSFSNWYFGTNGLTPAGQYDFVSVVLHELGHGLGFAGSMGVSSGGLGSWGFGSPADPLVYDRYVANGADQSLVNTGLFPNNSSALAAQLTSNNVFWNGSHGVDANGGLKAKLYAPTSWSGGSSIAHLDDATFPAGNPNSLMTHAIGQAEAIHNPGPIALGMFRDSGWIVSTGCSYSLSATSVPLGQAGGPGSVGVTTGVGCAWTATSNAAFITITGGASGSGNGLVTFSVSPNAGALRTGTITVAGQTFTVTQGPMMSTDRTSLSYGAVNTGGTLANQTSSQVVRVSFLGGDAPWTATPSAPWIQVTGGSGTGAGQFTVAAIGHASLPATGTVTSSVVVTSAGASNSPRTVTVRLTLFADTTTTAAPVGSFDTPVHLSTGLQGSIAVTGWALDDTEVARVEIWRDLAPGETTPPFGGGGLANGKVFIGNALFVNGARPDVEAAYPTTPLAYRAGWGYLMLTWGLWAQGNDTYTLYAFAYDNDGHATALVDAKTISVSNATANKPFGAIDTPGYGGTASGASFINFGWALTPPANILDPRNCVLSNGNVLVSVDSGPLVPVVYGSNRPDIQAGFPGFSNATTAGGAYTLNAAALPNGVHTIGWLATDSCGRTDGMGSRFFTVTGSATDAPSTTTAATNAAAAADAGVNVEPVAVRSNLDGSRLAYANAGGVRVVEVAQGDRVEVQVGARRAGRQLVNGRLRALPVGSSYDADYGTFYWQPAAGFLGSFDLEFAAVSAAPEADADRHDASAAPRDDGMRDRASERGDAGVVKMRVVVGPPLRMAIDTPRAGDVVARRFMIAGWALDLAAAEGAGVDTVHVWAYPVAGGAPVFLGVPVVGGARADVGATYGVSFAPSAYELVTAALAAGDYDIVVYIHRAATNAFEAAQGVRVSVM